MTGTGWRMVALPLGASCIAHAPALWAGFVYDDRNDLVANPSAQAETFLDRLPVTVRPLLKASYAVQDALHGMNATAFHAANLALHLCTVVLVFLLIRRALHLSGSEDRVAGRIAMLGTLLWALHPALTDTVSYISGRSMGLSGVLVLAAILAATGTKARPWAAFVCAGLAALARETALVAPLLLLAFQITVGRGQTRALARAAPVWIGALTAAAILASMQGHRALVGFSLDQRGPLDALRANVFALPEVLRLWVMPWDISILPAQPVSHGWTGLPTLLRLAGLALVPVAAIALRRRAPVAAFALLWTLLALLPTNSLIWRVDPVAVRPLYLAGIGVSLLSALILMRLRRGLLVGAALAAVLGVMTFSRAQLYRDEVALFADAAEKAPLSARAQVMLGLVLVNAGRLEEARAALALALALDPFDTEAINALRLLDAGGIVYSNPPP